MSDVRVLPVPEGSIIWLHDVDNVFVEDFSKAVRTTIEHDQFVIVVTEGDGAIIAVHGLDELVALVRAALDAEQRDLAHPVTGSCHHDTVWDPSLRRGVCKLCGALL